MKNKLLITAILIIAATALFGKPANAVVVVNDTIKTNLYNLETDHLGNVRAVFTSKPNNSQQNMATHTDYYPFGWAMSGRTYEPNLYRFGYQGQFAEHDEETGWNQFGLRLWDGRVGRWMTTDPAGQYYSSYMGMGNNPITGSDPIGGETILPWFFNSSNGDVYYSSSLGAGDASSLGSNWVFLGDDGMFGFSDDQLQYYPGAEIETNTGNSLSYYYRGVDAKNFMESMKYDFVPFVYEFTKDISIQLHPESGFRTTLIVDNSYISKVYSRQYAHKSSYKHTKILGTKSTDNEDLHLLYLFSPVQETNERDITMRQDTYKRHPQITLENAIKTIWKTFDQIVPWQDFFIQKWGL